MRARYQSWNQERLRRLYLAFSLSILISFGVTLFRIDPRLYPGDFVSFYSAGYIVNCIDASQLYNLGLQEQVQELLLFQSGRLENQGIIKFVYPLPLAYFFVPFTWIPLISAYFSWMGLGLLVLVFCVVRADSAMKVHGGWRSSAAHILIAATFLPVLVNLIQGQTALLALFLTVSGYLLLSRRSPILAGLTLGALAFKPQLLVGPLIFMLAQRKWRPFTAALSVVGLFAGLTTIVMGPSGFLSYPTVATQLLDDPDLPANVMPNVRGSLSRFNQWLGLGFGEDTLLLLSVASGAAALLFWLLFSSRRLQAYDSLFHCRFAEAIILGIVVSPHLFAYDASLLLLPVAIAVYHSAWGDRVAVGFAFCHGGLFLLFLAGKGHLLADALFWSSIILLFMLRWPPSVSRTGEAV